PLLGRLRPPVRALRPAGGAFGRAVSSALDRHFRGGARAVRERAAGRARGERPALRLDRSLPPLSAAEAASGAAWVGMARRALLHGSSDSYGSGREREEPGRDSLAALPARLAVLRVELVPARAVEAGEGELRRSLARREWDRSRQIRSRGERTVRVPGAALQGVRCLFAPARSRPTVRL